jgi:hypothetical protein
MSTLRRVVGGVVLVACAIPVVLGSLAECVVGVMRGR